MHVREKLETAMREAVEDGRLDEDAHGVLMEAARVCAEAIDEADEPTAALLTTMLNYTRALGLAPSGADADRRRKPRGTQEDSPLERLRRKHATGSWD